MLLTSSTRASPSAPLRASVAGQKVRFVLSEKRGRRHGTSGPGQAYAARRLNDDHLCPAMSMHALSQRKSGRSGS